MDMTSISAAQQSIKALLGIAKAATGAVVDHEVRSRLIEIQQGILDVQSQLGDAQADRLELMQEVQILRDRLRGLEVEKAKLDSYELHEIKQGCFLYKSKEGGTHPIAHFACPTCHNAGKVAVLQASKTGRAQVCHTCTACNFRLIIGPDDPVQRVGVRSGPSWTRDY